LPLDGKFQLKENPKHGVFKNSTVFLF